MNQNPSLKDLDNPIAWQYKQIILIKSDNAINKYYNNKILEKTTVQIRR